MGMSASQARLLYITAQLNNLSLQGQNVSDAKIRLAMDSERIQEKYTRALSNSRLYINPNIFTVDGAAAKSELITLENLKSQNLFVYDGSKILGYTYEKVDTGKTEQVIVGYEDDLTKPIYPTKTETDTFREADPTIPAYGPESLNKMNEIAAATGLGEDDIEVVSYTTMIGGQERDINSISIKSQAGFDAIMDQLANNPDAASQNYVLDLDDGEVIDLSGYNWHGISGFQGVFDGNGETIQGLNGDSGFFNSLYGVAKSINLVGANVSAETDALGAMSNYLADGASIENCNATDVNITCNLKPDTTYPEGYVPERASVGGLVGLSNGNVSNSSATGTINIPNADDSFGFIGGFIGANWNLVKGDSTIKNCYSDVDIRLGSGTDYSNSINNFIGDDSHETTIKNCVAMGAITTASGANINASDLACRGPVLESDVTNMVALDTRNNNNVLYWSNSTSPTYDSGNTNKGVLGTSVQETLSDGTKADVWLTEGDDGYRDQNQATSQANKLPVINLTELQEDALAKEETKETPDTTQPPIGYEQKPVYEEVPVYETVLVEDENFGGLSSLELETGIRNGRYQLVSPAAADSTQGFNINGTDYELVSLDSCTAIVDKQDDNALALAEAEYQKGMEAIQAQDKRYEMDQKKIDTQYDALLAEEESIKNVLNKNVERSFKTFG